MSAQFVVFHGSVVHTPTRGSLCVLPSAIVGVDGAGRIAFVSELKDQDVHHAVKTAMAQSGIGEDTQFQLKSLTRGQFLLPGLIDTHVHAPQYRFVGGATDKPLMEWLNHYTFPSEARMKNLSFADEVYRKLVKRLLKNGTTTALYFATIDLEPTKLLVDICAEYGQRACVGKVCADINSPSFYIESTSASISATESFIAYVHAKHPPHSPSFPGGSHPLIHPVVTPRFIPTCSPALLAGLGALAARHNVRVQSHISESLDQVAFTRSMYPLDSPQHFGSDARIFDSHGLLNKAVMAHGVHLTSADLQLMAERGAAVACCPLSNVFFAHGNLDVKRCWRENVDVGLGTDVAGGPLTTLVQAMRWAVGNARQIEVSNRLVAEAQAAAAAAITESTKTAAPAADSPSPVISWKDALYLATLGGAKALSLDEHVGTFEWGKEFDALLIDVNPSWDTSWDVFEEERGAGTGAGIETGADSAESDIERIEMWVEKFINLGDDRNIADVYVKGKRVAGCA